MEKEKRFAGRGRYKENECLYQSSTSRLQIILTPVNDTDGNNFEVSFLFGTVVVIVVGGARAHIDKKNTTHAVFSHIL